jgi:hypothetical protein
VGSERSKRRQRDEYERGDALRDHLETLEEVEMG